MTELPNYPLKSKTSPSWAPQALKDPLALLADQAYLEKKAANNALEFLNLWSSGEAPEHWLSSVAAIAKDETQHLSLVVRLLEKRGEPCPDPSQPLRLRPSTTGAQGEGARGTGGPAVGFGPDRGPVLREL